MEDDDRLRIIMAQVTLTIPDTCIQRVLDGFAASGGFDPTTGETKPQFLKRKLKELIISYVKAYESNLAATSARITSEASVDQDVSIT
jgi:hypothetical protein